MAMPSVEADSIELPLLRTTPFSHFLVSIVIDRVRDVDWDAFSTAFADGRVVWQGQQQQPALDYWRVDLGVDHSDGQGLSEILASRSPTEDELAWAVGSTDVQSGQAIADRLSLLLGYEARMEYRGVFDYSCDLIPATNLLSQLQGMSTRFGGDRAVLTGVKFAIEEGEGGSLEVGYENKSVRGTISGNVNMTLANDFLRRLLALAEERLDRYLRDQSSA